MRNIIFNFFSCSLFLRILIQKKYNIIDREMMNNLVYNDWERKESLFREKSDKENYQKQIEDLFTQLKEEKINYKNYYE